jgi:hypothetical protein
MGTTRIPSCSAGAPQGASSPAPSLSIVAASTTSSTLPPIGRFLPVRGHPLVLIDANGPIPGLVGKYAGAKMPKYFKGPDRPRLGDLAYTETAMFGF